MKFKKLIDFYQQAVAPLANQIDRDSDLIRLLLTEFSQQQLFRFHTKTKFGGIDLTSLEKIELQKTMGQHGSAFAFLMAQTQLAHMIIAQHLDHNKAQYYFDEAFAGRQSYAVGTAQLRMPNKLLFLKQNSSSNYLLTGRIPFASGIDILSHLLVGFETEDKQEGYAILPFKTHKQMHCSKPIDSLSMVGANTVSIEFIDYHLTEQELVVFKEAGYHNSIGTYIKPAAQILGCAQAALDLAAQSGKIKASENLQQKLTLLQKELQDCEQELSQPNLEIPNPSLQARMVKIGLDASQFCILLFGGAGMLLDHPAQRLYRQTAQYAITRQSFAVLDNWALQEQD